jgi:oxygen-independent coproporphyrinogen-3 oxidase
VPFCARRCSYCDFSIAVRRAVPTEQYIDRLSREIDLRVPDRTGWRADTLYLGGGTPSRLGADGIARLMERLADRFTLSDDAEVTVEANPDDITPDAVRSWRASGVNRLSIGIQSFDDRALAWMHRTHEAAQAVRAVEAARAGGIEQLSLDLIFALPDALGRDWDRDLTSALALDPSHISLYGLTIEPATPLGRWRDRGEVVEAPDERYEHEFLRAHERLVAAGFEHYEVSNYARPGYRARHNSSYWRRVPYAGFGPSAHSFDGETRRWNVAAYAEWARILGEGRDPIAGDERLTDENRAAELVYLGLRTTEGIEVEPSVARHVHSWLLAGWAVIEGGRLRLTPLGWLRLDGLATDLTAVGSRS